MPISPSVPVPAASGPAQQLRLAPARPGIRDQRVGERALVDRGFADFRPAYGTIGQHIADRGSRVTELAQLAQVTKPTVVYLVNDLERLGYVERIPDPADGRASSSALPSEALERKQRRERSSPRSSATGAMLGPLTSQLRELFSACTRRSGRHRRPRRPEKLPPSDERLHPPARQAAALREREQRGHLGPRPAGPFLSMPKHHFRISSKATVSAPRSALALLPQASARSTYARMVAPRSLAVVAPSTATWRNAAHDSPLTAVYAAAGARGSGRAIGFGGAACSRRERVAGRRG